MPGLDVHHLNCGTMCPIGVSMMGRETFVCHCLLVETNQGLVLVDTGLGVGDVTGKHDLPMTFTGSIRPHLSREETAFEQVRALGYSADDVRHIVVTHLDVDHAGGLPDFPNAAVHVHRPEHQNAVHSDSLIHKLRYLDVQWSHDPDWHTYEPDGESWHGFSAVRQLDGLPPDILMIPLAGHSLGHAGIAVRRDDGWLFHAGDAYFHQDEVRTGSCPMLLRMFQSFLQDDGQARRENQRRLRKLANADNGVEVFCAHDEREFATWR